MISRKEKEKKPQDKGKFEKLLIYDGVIFCEILSKYSTVVPMIALYLRDTVKETERERDKLGLFLSIDMYTRMTIVEEKDTRNSKNVNI